MAWHRYLCAPKPGFLESLCMGRGGRGQRRRMHSTVINGVPKSKEAQGDVFEVSHSLSNEFSFRSQRAGRFAAARAQLWGGGVHPQPATRGRGCEQEVSEEQRIHRNLEQREITGETRRAEQERWLFPSWRLSSAGCPTTPSKVSSVLSGH